MFEDIIAGTILILMLSTRWFGSHTLREKLDLYQWLLTVILITLVLTDGV